MTERQTTTEFLGRLARGPAQALLDRAVERSTTAAGLVEQLEGKSLQLDPGSPALAVYFRVADGQLRMENGVADEPDATLAGGPVSLARLAGPDPAAVIREGWVTVSGDSEVAEQFQYLLQIVRPDPEEELSRFTGDAVAHEVGRAASGLAGWADAAARSFNRSLAEYLTEESQTLVTRAEAEEFCAAVDTLSADVERLEARLRLLQGSD